MRGAAGIKSILWILAILSGVYGVMGTLKISNCITTMYEGDSLKSGHII